MKIRLFLFAACLALAGAFILSCSSDGGGGGDSGGDQQQSYNYCLYIDAQVCVAGPYKDCPAGGIPSNSCPFGDVEPSSSAGVSSSVETDNNPSSSSIAPSSSSIVPISSSSVSSYAYCIKDGHCLEGPFTLSECIDVVKGSPSNSCVVPSSSSAVLSSSSIPSSSSFAEPSSSSVASSSSSVTPSSSSALPSSSSEAESSSSSVPSSSSLGGGYTGSYGSLPYEGQTYKTVVIGTQTWMAENLNYAAEGSKCYSNLDSNCDIYGRLYNWETAMVVCPSGWHLPTQAEWNVMTAYIGGANTEGKKLKATSGWYNDGNGTDEYGFSALPGGGGYSDGYFYGVGNGGYWWSASEDEDFSYYAYDRYMYYIYEDARWGNGNKSHLFSVRCLQD